VFEKIFLIDSNIILDDYTNLAKLSQDGKNLLIIPEIVLDEIDSKKNGFDEINYQARSFARFLENSQIISSKSIDEYKIVRLKIDNLICDIISKDKYEVSLKETSISIINDRKILEIAKFANNYYDKEIEFISNDIMARIRATSLKINASFLKGDGSEEVDKIEFEKMVEIDFDEIEKLHNSPIIEFDKDYKVHNFSYCFKVRRSDQIILASIRNKKINILDEHYLRDQLVKPLNKEQLFFTNALLDSFYNIIIVEALAGSGKTLLALSSAMRLVKNKQFNKIIYIRNSIESLDKGEDVGYLPGLEEKFEIYNHPLMDSLRFIARSELKKKNQNKKIKEFISEEDIENRVELYLQNYKIQTMWVGEMRGRTLSESFVIIDEAQNMSKKTMQMVLSRIDESSKVVILGSNRQIDNFYVNKYTNALTALLKATKQETELVNLFAIRLRKVLRGPITEWAEKYIKN